MNSSKHSQPSKPAAPASADHLEQKAADVARRMGHAGVTDEDRKLAYKEMESTAPKVAPEEPASH